MLCSRSASLMTSTRGSRAIATIILRIVSACAASPYCTLSSLVTPSTRCATSEPKSADDRVEGVRRVLDRVVQQRGDQRDRVHAELGEDRRDRERVGDVGVAALAQLAAVVVLGDAVGVLQQSQVGLGVRGPVGRDQRLEHGARRRSGLCPAAIRRAIRARMRRWLDPVEGVEIGAPGPAGCWVTDRVSGCAGVAAAGGHPTWPALPRRVRPGAPAARCRSGQEQP